MNICLNCNKETTNPKYCSHSCSAIITGHKFPKRKRGTKTCRSCSELLENQSSIYCSQKCQLFYRFKTITLVKFSKGELTHSPRIKRCLTYFHGYICTICGNSGTHQNQSLVLQLDHIDGNSDNNLPENLRLLCPNCHSQTPTFATRQKKNTKRNRYLQKFKGY
jgi:5-methylcytosine-specific restriction endonuclease McrA